MSREEILTWFDEQVNRQSNRKPAAHTVEHTVAAMEQVLGGEEERRFVLRYLTGVEHMGEATAGQINALYAWVKPSWVKKEKRWAVDDQAAEGMRQILALRGSDEVLEEAQRENPQSAIHDNVSSPPPPPPMHQEARALVYTSFTLGGVKYNLTMREGCSAAVAKELLEQFRETCATMQRAGAQFLGVGAPAQPAQAPTAIPAAAIPPSRAISPTSPPTPPASAPAPTPPTNGANGDFVFQAETLSATVSEGKVYWKVKGGRFSQYGVMVWPEVLADAGMISTALDAAQVYDLSAFRAHYILNERGQPKKITKLERI